MADIAYDKYYFNVQDKREEKINTWKTFFDIHGMYPCNKNAKILEIGCADGVLLSFLKESGYEVSGIEYCENLAKISQSKGLNVVCADALEFLKDSEEFYDAIFLFDVLEHIEKNKQIQFLKLLNERLTDTGFIAMSIPNALTPIGSYFRYADFTHNCAYTEQSIRFVLQNAGFENPSIRPSHLEDPAIIELKQPWAQLCLLEFGMQNPILTPNIFAVAYKNSKEQKAYDERCPVFYNDYANLPKKEEVVVKKKKPTLKMMCYKLLYRMRMISEDKYNYFKNR